jgi:hypothetical protein
LFAQLPIPGEQVLRGHFQARFVGPRWLRAAAPPAIALSGLAGWWGKQLDGFAQAHNLVLRDQTLNTSHAMNMSRASSLIDGKPCAQLRYHSGFPWRWVVDELRVVDEGDTLLGMTLVDVPLLRGLAFPFVLERRTAHNRPRLSSDHSLHD